MQRISLFQRTNLEIEDSKQHCMKEIKLMTFQLLTVSLFLRRKVLFITNGTLWYFHLVGDPLKNQRKSHIFLCVFCEISMICFLISSVSYKSFPCGLIAQICVASKNHLLIQMQALSTKFCIWGNLYGGSWRNWGLSISTPFFFSNLWCTRSLPNITWNIEIALRR